MKNALYLIFTIFCLSAPVDVFADGDSDSSYKCMDFANEKATIMLCSDNETIEQGKKVADALKKRHFTFGSKSASTVNVLIATVEYLSGIACYDGQNEVLIEKVDYKSPRYAEKIIILLDQCIGKNI